MFSKENAHGPLYEASMWLAENHDELVTTLTDPFYAAPAVAGLAAAAATLAGGVYGLGSARHYLDRNYLRGPGDVVLGHRVHTKLDHFLRPLARQALRDRFLHTQVIGPTGQAKTTLLESLAVQDLHTSITTFVLETGGDLGRKLIQHARALGRPVHVFDPSVPTALKWNPLAGDDVTRVAEQAVSTLASSDSSSDAFFTKVNGTIFRRFVFATHAVAEYERVEPTLELLIRLLVDEKYRNKALMIQRDRPQGNRSGAKKDDGPMRVALPTLDDDNRNFFERQFLGSWTDRQRIEFTMGLQSALDEILGHGMARSSISPEAGQPSLDLRAALASGGLVVFKIPRGIVGDAVSRALSTWVLQRFQQETLDRGAALNPVVAYLDEVHNTLGHHNSAAAQSFSTWISEVRKYNVACYLAYQAFGMLPEVLQNVLESNARNKLISGGLGPNDVRLAQAMMGFEDQEVTDTRRTKQPGLGGGTSTVSVGRREELRPRYDEWEMRAKARGYWFYLGVRRGKLMHPMLTKASHAPDPSSHLSRGAADPAPSASPA